MSVRASMKNSLHGGSYVCCHSVRVVYAEMVNATDLLSYIFLYSLKSNLRPIVGGLILEGSLAQICVRGMKFSPSSISI